MPGMPSTPDPVRRSLIPGLTALGRAVLAGGAVVAVALAALVVAPRGDGTAAPAAAEAEVVTLDVPADADSTMLLAASVRSLARTGAIPASGRYITASAASRPTLRPGDRGRAIAVVQRRLGVSTTGYYGSMTYAAVTRFQKAHGLPARGIVGPRTWAALAAKPAAKATATKRTVRKAAAVVRRSSAPVTAGRVCPAPGAAFGDGWHAQRAGHLHQGMDLMGRRGMPILAIEDGVVIREGWMRNGAQRIVLQGRSGAKFFYGHMSKDLVHAGSRVKRGQVIGIMGDTGSPGAVHLHFEYWPSGGESAAVDAEPLLRRIC